jgi:hypothetical protein
MKPDDPQGELFGLVWQRLEHPFRLRLNDLIRIGDRLGRVIRVNECAAVVLMNRPMRQFSTRFDKPVRFQPSPLTFRISVNSETEILNRQTHERKRKPRGKEDR